jgi:hypothetical protein
MTPSENTRLVELRLSGRYAQRYGWVVNALTGWLSAFYMEDPRFRVSRRDHDLESGSPVWVCEIEGEMRMSGVLRRLQADVPAFQVQEGVSPVDGRTRYLIDLPEAGPDI